MITLGIDVGTTHTKVLALDTESHVTVALESAPTPVWRDEQGAAHRPRQVLETVLELMARVASTVPDASAVRALSVASVGEEVVLLGADGGPIGDAIAWYDPRGLAEAKSFLHGLGADLALTHRWPPDATFSLFKLLWLRRHAPDDLAAATTWTDLGDYVLHGLGGDLVMDWSHASRAGAFDIESRTWDPDTVTAAELDLDFPALVPGGTILGTLAGPSARRLGFPAELVLVSGGHDHLCAAYGAGVRSTAELFLSAGTSEAHLSLLDAPLQGPSARGVDQGCYVDDHTWYAHINIHSGHFFQQWRELLYQGVDEAAMYAELEASDAAGIDFSVTDDLRLGRLDAVPYDADRGAVMCAVLEGLARRSAGIIEHLEQAAGRPYESILVAGHPTRIALWRRLRQTAYGRPIERVLEPEVTAFGAAVMAAAAVEPASAAGLVAARHDAGREDGV